MTFGSEMKFGLLKISENTKENQEQISFGKEIKNDHATG